MSNTNEDHSGSPSRFNVNNFLTRGKTAAAAKSPPRGRPGSAESEFGVAARPKSAEQPRAKTAEAAAAVAQPARAISPVAVARAHVASLENHPLDEALSVIRKTSSEKSQPLILALLAMESFYKIKTRSSSEHVSSLLENILQSLAHGRKIVGDDATSHLDHLAKKLGGAGSNDLLIGLRAFLIGEIKNPRHVALIKPYVQVSDGIFQNENKPKATPIKADDLADLLLKEVTAHSIKRFFIIKHRRGDAARVVFDAIRASEAATANTHPGFPAVCAYLLAQQTSIALTEANTGKLITAALKPFYKSEKLPAKNADGSPVVNADGSPKLVQMIFTDVLANSEFGRELAKVEWIDKKTNQKRKLEKVGANIRALSFDRDHILNHFFPELEEAKWVDATPAQAGLAVFLDGADVKRVKA